MYSRCVINFSFLKNAVISLPKSWYEQYISIFKSHRPAFFELPFEFLLSPDSKQTSFETSEFKSKSHQTINFTWHSWKNYKSVLTGPVPNSHGLWQPARCNQISRMLAGLKAKKNNMEFWFSNKTLTRWFLHGSKDHPQGHQLSQGQKLQKNRLRRRRNNCTNGI